MPPRLEPLIEGGIIDSVIRPLMSGKEAQVYLVESDGRLCAAKVYKHADDRSFRHRSRYTEGRTVRNSRDQRAMGKRSKHGRQHDEASWNAAEADTIYKLDAAGVRVPKPFAFVEGVLVMECIKGHDGEPAPRLAECTLAPAEADIVFRQLLREVSRMLRVDIVHGDLSVFNVLIEEAGPVIIDFPQAVDAALNRGAREILLRDVANLTSHFKKGCPPGELRYGHELWDLYERGELHADTELTGHFDLPEHEVDTADLMHEMRLIDDELELERPGSRSGRPAGPTTAPPRHGMDGRGQGAVGRARGGSSQQPGQGRADGAAKGRAATVPGTPLAASSAAVGDAPPKRRARRRRRR